MLSCGWPGVLERWICYRRGGIWSGLWSYVKNRIVETELTEGKGVVSNLMKQLAIAMDKKSGRQYRNTIANHLLTERKGIKRSICPPPFRAPSIPCHWLSLFKHKWTSENKGTCPCVHKGGPPGAHSRVGRGESGDPEFWRLSSKENSLEYSKSEGYLI